MDVNDIVERAAAATLGPWHDKHDTFGCVVMGDYGWVAPGLGPFYDVDSEQGKADAEFIAHSRQDVDDLLAEVKRLQQTQDRISRMADQVLRDDERGYAGPDNSGPALARRIHDTIEGGPEPVPPMWTAEQINAALSRCENPWNWRYHIGAPAAGGAS